MKLKTKFLSELLTNKWVLNIIAVISLLNIIGYMIIGNLNNVIFFIILAILVRYFSKNMIIVLIIPLIIVNLISLQNNSYINEGMENNSNTKQEKHQEILKKALNDKNTKESSVMIPQDGGIVSSNELNEKSGFEVGRRKNGGSKIDYATTIEDAYDQLNQILGSDGIKNLTGDSQKLMQLQMELAKSMEGLTPIVEKMMPMASKMQEMMESMNSGGGGGMTNLMDMAQKMAKGLGAANKSQ
jgi:hypothetical protein